MPDCFVMQPFNPEFHSRYGELFAPAIRLAGFEPYRIDQKPDAAHPVDIVREIMRADACLADITVDNPNVWFELGYALAKGKPVCVVCGRERDDCPFDIRHLEVLVYDESSAAARRRSRERISARLQRLAGPALSLSA